ncbi:type II toxin-antitoxin system VapC family toxin [Kovacikia minuta CCNUW1]|uniref:type II toxin-antitoxin system VapC family toxin n=1 Tax=Kovacikia minuta TaxID=2931930 RepID=UPI001CCE8BD4|nr:type II toxin-antitoxin system VapC family toxin [Kovacikia minuta]UBF29345.1 type II toxin-antitoxin system VapC family toxin [Kovacikia minuta CCNUW1]
MADPLPSGQYHVSIITEMELLSYPSLSPTEEQQIRSFLAQMVIVRIDDPIKNAAITLRKQHRLKLPDAIIAATAQSLSALLLTNDLKLSNLGIVQAQSMSMI